MDISNIGVNDQMDDNERLKEHQSTSSPSHDFLNFYLCPSCLLPIRISRLQDALYCSSCSYYRPIVDELGFISKQAPQRQGGFKLSNDPACKSTIESNNTMTTSISSSSSSSSTLKSYVDHVPSALSSVTRTDRPSVVKNNILGRNKQIVHPNYIAMIYHQLKQQHYSDRVTSTMHETNSSSTPTNQVMEDDHSTLLDDLWLDRVEPVHVKDAITTLGLNPWFSAYVTQIYCALKKCELPNLDFAIEIQSDRLYEHLSLIFKQYCQDQFNVYSNLHMTSFLWSKVWRLKSQTHLLKFVCYDEHKKNMLRLEHMWECFYHDHQTSLMISNSTNNINNNKDHSASI